jgi:hypothetical protein
VFGITAVVFLVSAVVAATVFRSGPLSVTDKVGTLA